MQNFWSLGQSLAAISAMSAALMLSESGWIIASSCRVGPCRVKISTSCTLSKLETSFNPLRFPTAWKSSGIPVDAGCTVNLDTRSREHALTSQVAVSASMCLWSFSSSRFPNAVTLPHLCRASSVVESGPASSSEINWPLQPGGKTLNSFPFQVCLGCRRELINCIELPGFSRSMLTFRRPGAAPRTISNRASRW